MKTFSVSILAFAKAGLGVQKLTPDVAEQSALAVKRGGMIGRAVRP